MFGDHVLDQHLAPGGSHSSHIGPRLDLVGDDGVGAASEPLHPVDLDHISARAPDIRPHRVEEVGQVHDMGLFRGVLDHRHALGQGGGQHDVHRGPHRDHVQIDLPPGQTAPVGDPGIDQAVAHVHLCPHGHEALDMLIDGPPAKVAAAGQGDLGPAEPAEQGPHQIIAGADLPGQLIGDLTVSDMGTVYLYRASVDDADVRPQLTEDLEDQGHVADLRHVLDPAHAVHQQGGRDDSDSGVLRAADMDGPMEGIASLDHILGQIMHPLFHILESMKIRRGRRM